MSTTTNLFEIQVFTNRQKNAWYRLYDNGPDFMKVAMSLTSASEVTLVRVYLDNILIHEWRRPVPSVS